MRKIRKTLAWLDGWRLTLYIKYFQPELYRQLLEPINMDEYVEVFRPEADE
jgi:hypothetical protein